MAASIQKLAVQAFRTFSKKYDALPSSDRIKNLKEMMKTISARDLNIDERLLANVDVSSGVLPLLAGDMKACVAPVTYMHVWEDDVLSMGVFVLKRGACIPIHDHPGMFGLIKIIHGTASIQTYTVVDSQSQNNGIGTDDADTTCKSDASKVHISQSATEGTTHQHHGAFNMDAVNFTDTSLDYSIDNLPMGCTVDVLKNPIGTITPDGEASLLTPHDYNFHEIRANHGTVAFLDILAPPYDHETLSRVCHYYREVAVPEAPSPGMCRLSHIDQPADFWCDSVNYTGPKIEWPADDDDDDDDDEPKT